MVVKFTGKCKFTCCALANPLKINTDWLWFLLGLNCGKSSLRVRAAVLDFGLACVTEKWFHF